METCIANKTLEDLDTYKYSSASWAFVLVFVPIVTVFGILCNVAFIVVVYRVHSMRNITNIYLVNLAIADSSLLTIAVCQYIGDYIVLPDYDLRFSFHSTIGCFMPNMLIYLCYYASLWTITIISIERYFAICHPFWHRVVSSKQRSVRMVLAAWFISAIFAGFSVPYTAISLCVLSPDMEVVKIIPSCRFYCDWCAFVLYITDVLQFIIALISNTILYVLIVINLNKETYSFEDNARKFSEAIRTRNAVTKMLVINGILFFVCLFPFSIANIDSIVNYFGLYPFHTELIFPIGWAGRVLFLLNSAINPVIYNITNPRYRSAFKAALLGRNLEHYCNNSLRIRSASQESQISNKSNITRISIL